MITSISPEGLPPAMFELIAALTVVVQAIVCEQIQPLKDELKYVKSRQSEWMTTKEVLHMIGRTQAETLKAERERPNTLLVYKHEGRTLRYLRDSVVAYSAGKIRRRVVGHALGI